MFQQLRITCCLLGLFFASCTSTLSLAELEQAQDTAGFNTKSLYYVGSSRGFHYFDQFTLLGRGWWIPGFEDDGYRSHRIPRSSLSLPPTWEFANASYRGPSDERRVKVRIGSTPTPSIDRRVAPQLSMDDYQIHPTGPSIWTVERSR